MPDSSCDSPCIPFLTGTFYCFALPWLTPFSTPTCERWRVNTCPGVFFDYIDGGDEDEVTVQYNKARFVRYQLLPRILADFSAASISAFQATAGCGDINRLNLSWQRTLS